MNSLTDVAVDKLQPTEVVEIVADICVEEQQRSNAVLFSPRLQQQQQVKVSIDDESSPAVDVSFTWDESGTPLVSPQPAEQRASMAALLADGRAQTCAQLENSLGAADDGNARLAQTMFDKWTKFMQKNRE
jgi:hypothetical protein